MNVGKNLVKVVRDKIGFVGFFVGFALFARAEDDPNAEEKKHYEEESDEVLEMTGVQKKREAHEDETNEHTDNEINAGFEFFGILLARQFQIFEVHNNIVA